MNKLKMVIFMVSLFVTPSISQAASYSTGDYINKALETLGDRYELASVHIETSYNPTKHINDVETLLLQPIFEKFFGDWAEERVLIEAFSAQIDGQEQDCYATIIDMRDFDDGRKEVYIGSCGLGYYEPIQFAMVQTVIIPE